MGGQQQQGPLPHPVNLCPGSPPLPVDDQRACLPEHWGLGSLFSHSGRSDDSPAASTRPPRRGVGPARLAPSAHADHASAWGCPPSQERASRERPPAQACLPTARPGLRFPRLSPLCWLLGDHPLRPRAERAAESGRKGQTAFPPLSSLVLSVNDKGNGLQQGSRGNSQQSPAWVSSSDRKRS